MGLFSLGAVLVGDDLIASKLSGTGRRPLACWHRQRQARLAGPLDNIENLTGHAPLDRPHVALCHL
jgi:hypothetical protein